MLQGAKDTRIGKLDFDLGFLSKDYDVDTRSFIITREQIVDRSSRMDLVKNADGSVDLYTGPEAPKGFEKNWIPTVPGRGWFTLFRLYAPTEAYFDKSWPLPNIELVK